MVTLSLCMIVKNEEAVLGRCLDSVKDVVDEIVIVDTGSSDKTKSIAKAYTDKIFDFPWNDDFSAARNDSFSRAAMDYCMWLDAAVGMAVEQKKRLEDWKQQADGTADVVMMKYVTGFDEQGRAAFSYYRERLLKRSSGFLWKGRVHEAIAAFGKTEYLDISIEHRSQKKTYGTRNLDIYEGMVSEGVQMNARDLFYYGRELYYHGRYEKSLEIFCRFLNEKEAFVENQVEACRFASYCEYGLGREKEALEFLLRGLGYRVPGGELCCDLGKHYMDRREWKQAVFWFTCALQAPRQEQTGGFVQEECYGYLPCIQLSVCYDRLGEKENALKYHRMAGDYKPYGKEYLKNQEYFCPM